MQRKTGGTDGWAKGKRSEILTYRIGMSWVEKGLESTGFEEERFSWRQESLEVRGLWQQGRFLVAKSDRRGEEGKRTSYSQIQKRKLCSTSFTLG